MEAISCRTPVISYKTGGSSESAKNFGALIKKGNINGIVKEIKKHTKNIYTNFKNDNRNAVKEYLNIYKGK